MHYNIYENEPQDETPGKEEPMQRVTALFVLLLLLGLLTGCNKQPGKTDTPTPTAAPTTGLITKAITPTPEAIPEYAAHIKGIEQYLDPVDYSDPENWLSLPETPEKSVDAIYLYPTVYGTVVTAEDDIAHIDDVSMRIGAVFAATTQASVFEEQCNLFIPYYRQFTVEALLDMNENHPEAMSYCVSQDIYGMLDYYFEHLNKGRPFILAGHSQGSLWMTYVLEDYMKQHPEYLENMVAAYIIGYSVTEDYLSRNPHLKFAEGATDTGVIISYNTEGSENHDQFNCVVLEGAIAINPINWKRDGTYASAEENLGSLSTEGEIEYNKADARLDTERGVVICDSVESVPELQEAMQNYFGPESYHLQDYSLYFMNLRQNVADRIDAFKNK